MIRKLLTVLGIVISVGVLAAQPLGSPNGIGISVRPLITTAATDGALALWGNPAAIGTSDGFGVLGMFPADKKDYRNDFALALRGGGFAIGGEWLKDVPAGVPKQAVYHWAVGFKTSDGLYFGTRYRWSKHLNQQNSWSAGMLARPVSWLSFGTVMRDVNEPEVNGVKQKPAYDFGVAMRPLALTGWRHGHRITAGVDLSWYETPATATAAAVKYGDKLDPRYFVEVEPLDGVKLQAQYASDSEELRAGLAVTSQRHQLSYHDQSISGDHNGSITSYRYESDGLLSLLLTNRKFLVRMKMPAMFEEQRPGFSFFGKRAPELETFLKQIRRLTKDREVKALLLEVEDVNYGMAKLQAVIRELRKFKQAGKPVYVYAKSLDNRGYALASVADKIYLYPEGLVFLNGVASGGLFLRGTLDKLGIYPEAITSGPHKTAPNMLTEHEMTAEDRAQREWLIGDWYRQFVEMIATNRGWTAEQTRTLVDNGPYSVDSAIAVKLVDGKLYPDEVDKTFKKFLEPSSEGKKVFSFHRGVGIIGAAEYFHLPEVDPRWDRPFEPKIAIIYAVGSIVSGKSGNGFLTGHTMGSETMVKAIRAARNDAFVKAIVLRIDSPGGSGFASDEIWRELMLCSEDTANPKPVIVSFSDVAASGGYYIATPGKTIVSEEGSITGSIGVLMLRLVFDSTLSKVGSNYQQLKFARHAGMFSLWRRHTPEENALVEREIKEFYHRFVQKVSDSRKKPWSSVDSVGNGRVWTGQQALRNGLVDTIGGLDLAIELAKMKANISSRVKPDILVYPQRAGFDVAVEVQEAAVRLLPEPLRESLRKSYAAFNVKPNEIMLVAPDWLTESELLSDPSAADSK